MRVFLSVAKNIMGFMGRHNFEFKFGILTTVNHFMRRFYLVLGSSNGPADKASSQQYVKSIIFYLLYSNAWYLHRFLRYEQSAIKREYTRFFFLLA